MSSIRYSFSQLILFACVAAIAGCHSSGQSAKGPTTAPQSEWTWSERPIAVPPQPAHAVKEGPAPLVYMVESDSVIRVVDQTANVELLLVPVMSHQIVVVNPDIGVQVGGATMKPGRLAPDHRYGIYIQSNQENVQRIGSMRPGGTIQNSQPRSSP